jgi:magnesium transporter
MRITRQAGISQDVEADDSIFEHKSALAVVSFSVTRRFYFGKSAGLFEGHATTRNYSFTPLIAAMAGNVECNLGN